MVQFMTNEQTIAWPQSLREAKNLDWLAHGFEDPKKVTNWKQHSEHELLDWAAARVLWCLLRGAYRKATTAFKKQLGLKAEEAEAQLGAVVRRASRITIANKMVKVELDVEQLKDGLPANTDARVVAGLTGFAPQKTRAESEIAHALAQNYGLTEDGARDIVCTAFRSSVVVSSSDTRRFMRVDLAGLRRELASLLGVGDDSSCYPIGDVRDVCMTFEEIRNMPQSLKRILEEHPGVYLITDTSDGKQYVGSAYGAGNIGDRWRAYGEGRWRENKLLRGRNPANFQFEVLELLDTDASESEVIQAETRWKKEKNTYFPNGLNAN